MEEVGEEPLQEGEGSFIDHEAVINVAEEMGETEIKRVGGEVEEGSKSASRRGAEARECLFQQIHIWRCWRSIRVALVILIGTGGRGT